MASFINNLRIWNKRRKISRKKTDIWLLPNDKTVCIELRKVGSRSIRSTLAQHLLSQEKGAPYLPTDAEVHSTHEKYSQHLTTAQLSKLKSSHYIFTLVRNPLARLYSCYADKIVRSRQDSRRNRLEFYGVDYSMTFEDFVYHVNDMKDEECNSHFRPVYSFLTHNGQLLPEKICKLESITEDWSGLQSRIKGLPDLIKINSTDKVVKNSYKDAYSKQLAETVYARFYKDIELLDYEENIKAFIAGL